MGTSMLYDAQADLSVRDKDFYQNQIIRGLRKSRSYPTLRSSTVYVSDKYLPGYSARRKQHDWQNWNRFWTDRTYYYKPIYSAVWPYGTVSENNTHTKRWPTPNLPPKFVKYSHHELYDNHPSTLYELELLGETPGKKSISEAISVTPEEAKDLDRAINLWKQRKIRRETLEKYWFTPSYGARNYRELYHYLEAPQFGTQYREIHRELI